MGYNPSRQSLEQRRTSHQTNTTAQTGSARRDKRTPKPWYHRVRWKKVALCVFALYVAFNLIGGVFQIVDLKKQQAVVAEQLNQAYAEQAQLQQKIDYMNTEEAIERAAREKLGLVKPGEIIVVRATNSSDE